MAEVSEYPAVFAQLEDGTEIMLEDCITLQDVKIKVASQCKKMAPEIMICDEDEKQYESNDMEKEPPSMVFVKFRDVDYTSELLQTTVLEHAQAGDSNGARQAMSSFCETELDQNKKTSLQIVAMDESEMENSSNNKPFKKKTISCGATISTAAGSDGLTYNISDEGSGRSSESEISPIREIRKSVPQSKTQALSYKEIGPIEDYVVHASFGPAQDRTSHSSYTPKTNQLPNSSNSRIYNNLSGTSSVERSPQNTARGMLSARASQRAIELEIQHRISGIGGVNNPRSSPRTPPHNSTNVIIDKKMSSPTTYTQNNNVTFSAPKKKDILTVNISSRDTKYPETSIIVDDGTLIDEYDMLDSPNMFVSIDEKHDYCPQGHLLQDNERTSTHSRCYGELDQFLLRKGRRNSGRKTPKSVEQEALVEYWGIEDSAEFPQETPLVIEHAENDAEDDQSVMELETPSEDGEKLESEVSENRDKELQLITKARNPAIAEMLVNSGQHKDINVADIRDGTTPLWRATYYGHEDLVDTLILFKADVNSASANDGTTPLWRSIYGGHSGITKILIKADANVNCVDSEGASSLWLATYRGRADIVQLLVDGKASVDQLHMNNGETALWRALYWKRKEIAEILLNAKASVQFRNKDDLSPLQCAIATGDRDLCDLLIKGQANLHELDVDGETSILRAIMNKQSDICSLLIECKSIMEFVDADGESLLYRACAIGHYTTVEILIDQGKVPLEFADTHGETALWRSAHDGQASIVHLLLHRQANINTTDNDGASPLLAAASNHKTKCVRLLLQARPVCVIVDQPNQNGETPLWSASKVGADDIVLLLMAAQAHVGQTDNDGETAIWRAAKEGHTKVMEALMLSKDFFGPNLDKANTANETALCVAAAAGFIEIVEILLDANADPAIVNYNKQKPIQLAYENGHNEIVEMLQEHNETKIHRRYRLDPVEEENTQDPSTDTESVQVLPSFTDVTRNVKDMVSRFIES